MRTSLFPLLALAAVGCDYSGDWLFGRTIEGLPSIYELKGPDGGLIVPATITTIDELREATIYAEVGPSTTTAYGGVTFEFQGTGDAVCIWVDPEVAFWNQAVAVRPDDVALKWAYPDNVFDDGDLDLLAGLSVYYTGSPGEEIGDFVVAYEDSLGNDIPISLAACPNTITDGGDDAVAGRGSPEYCSIPTTDLNISYTVLLRTWSTPLDDDRLSYGVIIANGTCEALRGVAGAGSAESDECVIMGEALIPKPLGEDEADYQPYYGFNAAVADDAIWPNSMEFDARMRQFCNRELERIEEAGLECLWNEFDPDDFDPNAKCYCGDPLDTPEGGAF